MLKPALAALLLAASAAHGSAQLRNLTFDVQPDLVAGGATVVSHFDVMTAASTGSYYALAIAPGAASAPSAGADWVIDEGGTYASSKPAPTNACPQTGYAGPVEGGSTPVWMPVTASFRMPAYAACAAKKLFVVAYEGPTMDSCSYQASLSAAFTYNGAGCPTATPTRTSTPSVPTATPTRTSTPGAGTPTSTRTTTPVLPPTSTATMTAVSTPAATGPSAQPIRVVRALMVPNPNPSSVSFDLRGAPDEIRVGFYSEAYSLVAEVSAPGAPAGWRSVPIPAMPSGGTYFVRVSAMSGGSDASHFVTVARVQR